ncbi:MAG: FkbM family methyltransferase [Acidobacteriota bacterium]
MTNPLQTLKQAAKSWLRPALTPAVRWAVRHAPVEQIRRPLWAGLVVPFFQYSQTNFVVTTVFGATMAGNTRDHIQRHIYYFGLWEPNLTSFLSSRLREGDVFIDVGANIGYFSLLASRLVGRTGEVRAIEASPATYAKLLDNIGRNQATNIQAVNAAVSDRPGTVRIFRGEESNIGSTSIVSQHGRHFECEIAADRLDALLPEALRRRVRFVKIDVEGAEWLVIDGMRDLVKDGPDNLEILVELQPTALAVHGKSVDDVVSLFAEFGFRPYRIENDYSVLNYMAPGAATRPVRMRSAITTQTDVVFSRIDAEFL